MTTPNEIDSQSSAWKHRLFGLLQWTLIFGCFLYAVWELDFASFLESIKGYNLVAVMIATLLNFVGYLALSKRLINLLGGRINFLVAVVGTIVGQGVNNILPAKLGEGVKMWFIARESREPAPLILTAIFWERFFDLNILLLLGFLIVLGSDSTFSIGSFSLLVLGLWFFLIVTRHRPAWVMGMIQWVPVAAVREFLLQITQYLSQGLSGRNVVNGSFWSVVLWLQYVTQVTVILLWAAEMDLSLTAILVIFVVSGIGMNLAASPGGLGVYEAAIVVSASWFDVSRENALAAAIVLHFVQYVPSCVIGLFLMSQFNINLKDFRTKTAKD